MLSLSSQSSSVHQTVSPLAHLLFMAVEILEILVIVEGHVSDGVALALLVGGVHDRVGGVREVHQVAAVLQRFHNLRTNR